LAAWAGDCVMASAAPASTAAPTAPAVLASEPIMFPPKVLIDSVFLGLGHKWHSTGKMVFVRCSQWIAGSEEHGRVFRRCRPGPNWTSFLSVSNCLHGHRVVTNQPAADRRLARPVYFQFFGMHAFSFPACEPFADRIRSGR
jgi:hypothetical protein